MLAFVCQRTTVSTVGSIVVPFAGCTVHPPRFRAQSKLSFQPWLGSSATALIQVLLLALCWFGKQSYKAIRNQVSVILNHQSSPTSLIQNEHLSTLQISYRWLRTSPRKSAVPLFFPFEQISWHPDFIGCRIKLLFFFYFFILFLFPSFPFFLFHLTGIGPTLDSIFDVVRNTFSVPFKTRCPLVLVFLCKCVLL